MYQFLLPDAGEGTHESEVLEWFVAEGDEVTEDQILLEIQSDKAAVEIPSPVAGRVAKLHVPAGDMAIVGKPIADIDTTGSHAAPAAPATEPAEPVEESAPAPASTAVAPASNPDVDVRTIAVPRVRKFARENGVDLTAVTGTGSGGKVTMDDVSAFLANLTEPAPQAPAPSVSTGDTSEPAPVVIPAAPVPTGARREKLTPMRRATAKALVASRTLAPHVTVLDKVEVSALVAHRARLKEKAAAQGVKLTYTPYLVKAAVAMLKKHPIMNASIDMDAGEIVYKDTFHVGVATNTEAGLFVPMVRDADRVGLFEIARRVEANQVKATAGQLATADMTEGSLTITNVGGAATGGVWSTPIINSPESAIIGIGRIEEEFLPDSERQPVLLPVMKISFAFDHRLVDGVAAQRALNDFKAFLNDPDLLLGEG